MFINEFTKEYIDRVMQDPSEYEMEYRRIMSRTDKKRILCRDEKIDMNYQGFFFEEKDLVCFENIIHTMASIGQKVTAKFIEDPEYRKKFRFSKAMEDLIMIDPGYTMPVPVGRYDIFYNGDGDFKFCELNTDGSSAMNEDRVLGKILKKSRIMKEMAEEWDIKRFELFRSLVEALTSIYKDYMDKLPNSVAIVDFDDKGNPREFKRFHKIFEEMGFDCTIVDPSKMVYRDGKLYGVDDFTGREAAIDLVYRRVVTSDFLERINECSDFLQAYKDGAFITMGSFRSQIMHSKLIFKVLRDPDTLEFLSDKEQAFVKAHVPFTKEILDRDDLEEVKKNKDKYIIKPYNSYASQGIILGRDWDQDEWNRKIDLLPLDKYIYQDYVDMEPTPFLHMEDYKFKVEGFNHVIGLFMYGEKFVGTYSRIGRDGLVASPCKYYVAPGFVVKRK